MPTQLMLPSEALNRQFELPEAGEFPAANLVASKAVIECHSFTIGPIGLLLPGDTVAEVFDELPHSRIPNAPRSLRFMANVRGDMVPVFSLHTILGVEETENMEYRMLVIGQRDMAIGLLVDNLPMRLTLTQEYILKSEPILPESLTPFVRECYQYKGQIWVDWDIYGFFSAIVNEMH
ncbi:MAG: chemotaxis protein CheW [Gammaproteobacteria bacterium]|nr:chemotaxis protein CheW [Gammaproteobacteria bacterium]